MTFRRCAPLFGLVTIVCLGWTQAPGYAKRPIIRKTIQSLGDGSRGKYLAVDNATGAVTIQDESNVEFSGTWWELDDKYANVYRGYPTNRIRNRGNNAINGQPLVIDDEGKLSFAEVDGLIDSQRWIVSYAGFYRGYHAFFIQNTDMEFLTLEGGAVKLSRPLLTGAYWHIRSGPSLPTDQIK